MILCVEEGTGTWLGVSHSKSVWQQQKVLDEWKGIAQYNQKWAYQMEIAEALKQMTIISKTDQISSMNCDEEEKEMGWRLF